MRLFLLGKNYSLQELTNIIDKKEGTLWLMVYDNTFTNQNDDIVSKTRTNYNFVVN